MPLSCSCEEWEDADWYCWSPTNYSKMPKRRARVRCASCKKLIDAGTVVAVFSRSREARTEIECNIYGEGDPESISLADGYLCEECADLFFSLDELGFCVSPYENQRELVKEYADMRSGNQYGDIGEIKL